VQTDYIPPVRNLLTGGWLFWAKYFFSYDKQKDFTDYGFL
jgi:hypothetical protein